MSFSRFDRRRFLKVIGAACATPLVIPASALGLESTPAPSQRITVGMIGVGRQATKKNLKQFFTIPDVQVVAVCDVDSWRLAKARTQVNEAYAKDKASGTYKGCAAYPDFHELLARQDIDAVMISTPDHWHAPMALAAFDAGKDVSLEKPITRTIAEGRQLTDAAARLNRVFRVDSEMRSNKSLHRAATLVRNGLVGKVVRVTVGVPAGDQGYPYEPAPDMPVPPELDYERWQGPAPRATYTVRRVHDPKSYSRPGWMRHLYYCDGMIANWGTHFNDVALWATDLDRTGPIEIEGRGVYPPKNSFWNVLWQFECQYRFANGIQWTYKIDKPYFRVEGTEGWIQADATKVEAQYASIMDWKPGPDAIQFRMKTDKQDFIDCVKTRGETLEPAEVGHRVTSLCHLGHIAIQLRQKLQWNPEKERFLDNDAANAMIDMPIRAPSNIT
jgi:myo-inositol 2-dehydrogenase / D-chiro-inositol 1-dehydrogenase